MFRTLVISSCTARKVYQPPHQLTSDDLREPGRLRRREQELAAFSLPAGEMYRGRQHRLVMEGIERIRGACDPAVVDLCIFSAGYGLIPADRVIAPYDVTFAGMRVKEIQEWSRLLGIKKQIAAVVRGYDLVLFLLGERYLRALHLPVPRDGNQTLVFLASKTSCGLIPPADGQAVLTVGPEEASAYKCALVSLKGLLFKHLAGEVARHGCRVLKQVAAQPADWLKYTGRHFDNSEKRLEQARFSVFMPAAARARNFGWHPVRYFIPEWDDRVDPRYDFFRDRSKDGFDSYRDGVYAHEIYPAPNYDGVLFSKTIVDRSKTKSGIIRRRGAKDYIRLPDKALLMGDCGAFGYVDHELPPYSTDEILTYYQQLRLNYGVSVDHLIVGPFAADPVVRRGRQRLTMDNAEEFLRKHREGNFDFVPIGVAQGWDPPSYAESVDGLIDLGYDYIALGGLARAPTKTIVSILQAVAPLIPDYLQVHLFGSARLEALEVLCRLGVTSFDSASPLRRAWLGAGKNYHGFNGRQYAAVRVPPVDGHGIRVKRLIEQGKGTKERFKQLEQRALAALRGFDRGRAGLEETLETVLAYDELLGEGREKHAEMYRCVLQDKPWKECPCPICRDIGIEVIIFRGNNRNRRRGFHNTFVFYRQMRALLKRMGRTY